MDDYQSPAGHWTAQFEAGDYVQWDALYTYVLSEIDLETPLDTEPWNGVILESMWVPETGGWVYHVHRIYSDGSFYPDNHRYLLDEDILQATLPPNTPYRNRRVMDTEIMPLPLRKLPLDLTRPIPAWLLAKMPYLYPPHDHE